MTNFEVDLLSALDWQRSNAPIIKQLVKNQQAWLDANHAKFWNDWINNVFTLGAADEFGLAVWSIILDEQVYGYSGPSPVGDYFGFSEDSENFYDGNFAVDDGYTYEFTLEQKRILLQLKAYKVLAVSGPVGQINTALPNIFGSRTVTCFDNLDMTFTYKITDSNLFDFINEIMARDLFPRPIGIEIKEILFI